MFALKTEWRNAAPFFIPRLRKFSLNWAAFSNFSVTCFCSVVFQLLLLCYIMV